jgi:hypothetical protein
MKKSETCWRPARMLSEPHLPATQLWMCGFQCADYHGNRVRGRAAHAPASARRQGVRYKSGEARKTQRKPRDPCVSALPPPPAGEGEPGHGRLAVKRCLLRSHRRRANCRMTLFCDPSAQVAWSGSPLQVAHPRRHSCLRRRVARLPHRHQVTQVTLYGPI